MELRSAKRKDYKTSLIGLGLYEDGMKLEEMKQVMQALEESQLECETVFFESDMERALKESELDYVRMRCDVHSSTMIRQTSDNNLNIIKPLGPWPRTPAQYLSNSDASPFSSPEIASGKIIVKAIVHNDLNWSPPPLEPEIHVSSAQKRLQSIHNNCNTEKRKVVENESDACNIKRSRPPITSPAELLTGALGISSECELEDQNQEYYSDPSF